MAVNRKIYIKNLVDFFFKKERIGVFDAGCHKGVFLKKIGLRRVKRAILVDPTDFNLKKKKIFKNFKYFKYALGNKKKIIKFYRHSNKNPEWSSVNKIHLNSPYFQNYKKRLLISPKIEKIKQTTIDKILKKNKFKIDLLKIDCQSQSLEVLQGATNNLKKKDIQVVVCAVNLTEFYSGKSDDFARIVSFLKKFNYQFYKKIHLIYNPVKDIYLDEAIKKKNTFLYVGRANDPVKRIKLSHDSLIKIPNGLKNLKIWTFDAIFVKKELLDRREKAKSVVIFGHGVLPLGICKFLIKNKNFNLKMVVASKNESIIDLSLQEWCRKNNIYVETNLARAWEKLGKENYDLALSLYYDKIFKSKWIDKFNNFLNLHNSILPDYRGVNPVDWSIFKREKYLGVTLFQITNKIDQGYKIKSSRIKIDPKKIDVFEGNIKCFNAGYKVVKHFLLNYKHYQKNKFKKISKAGTIYTKRQTRQLLKNHHFLNKKNQLSLIMNRILKNKKGKKYTQNEIKKVKNKLIPQKINFPI